MTIQSVAEMVAIPGGRPGPLKTRGKSGFGGKLRPIANQWVSSAVGKHPAPARGLA